LVTSSDPRDFANLLSGSVKQRDKEHTVMWNLPMNQLRALYADVVERTALADAEIARAVLSLFQGDEITQQGPMASDPGAKRLASILAWWLFLRAPSLRVDYLVLSPMTLDLVLQNARSIDEVLEDLSTLEQAAKEGVEDDLEHLVSAKMREAFATHGALRDDLQELEEDALHAIIVQGLEAYNEDPEVSEAITREVMDDLLDEFDQTGRTGTLRALFEGTNLPDETMEDGQAELDSPSDYAARAEMHYEEGELELAMRDFARALSLEPTSIRALVGLAVIRASVNELDQAIDLLDRALAHDPEDLSALHNRALVRYARGEFEEAIADFGAVIDRDAEDGEAWLNRANARAETGAFDEALADATRASELLADSSRPLVDRAVIKRAMGDHDGAIKDFGEALERDAEDADALAGRGFIYLEHGHYEQAEKDLDAAIERQSWRGLLYYNRGNARGARGNFEGAIEDYTRAIEIDEDDIESLINRGTAHLKLENLKGALEDWDRALRIDPYQPEAHLKRGAVLLLNDEPEYASRDLEQALENAPEGWEFEDAARMQLAEARRRIDAAEEEE
jgi:tetratricopeptide (TPR) repeat protein